MRTNRSLAVVALFLLLLSAGCSNPVANSLLTDQSSSCDSITDSSCSTDNEGDDSTSSSAVEIQADSDTLTANMDGGDIVEITGTCKDQGRRKNRILVEVFAGELDETVSPYISNDFGTKCLSVVPDLSGIAAGSECFWVTKGAGLVEDALLPSERKYPQCHNGQFGFSVRLGKILTEAQGTKYQIRMKLQTEDGSISQSTWNRVTVSRGLTAPAITTALVVPSTISCNLTNLIPRFNENIEYTLNRTFQLRNGTTSAVVNPVMFTGITSANTNVFSFVEGPLVEGVPYTYSITAEETEYTYLTPQTKVSSTIPCRMNEPVLVAADIPTTGSCYLSVAVGNPDPTVEYEIQYGSAPNWSGTPPSANGTGTVVGCASGTIRDRCQINLPSNVTYYFAVRAFRDTVTANNVADITEESGFWSNEISCRPP